MAVKAVYFVDPLPLVVHESERRRSDSCVDAAAKIHRSEHTPFRRATWRLPFAPTTLKGQYRNRQDFMKREVTKKHPNSDHDGTARRTGLDLKTFIPAPALLQVIRIDAMCLVRHLSVILDKMIHQRNQRAPHARTPRTPGENCSTGPSESCPGFRNLWPSSLLPRWQQLKIWSLFSRGSARTYQRQRHILK